MAELWEALALFALGGLFGFAITVALFRVVNCSFGGQDNA